MNQPSSPIGKKAFRATVTLFIIVLLFLNTAATFAADGPPIVPSSFYGVVSITDPAPSAGVVLVAYLNGSVAASVPLKKSGSDLVYAINVPGVAADEGHLITFRIGADPATRIVATATWHSGINVRLDIHPPAVTLSASALPLEGSPVTIIANTADIGSDVSAYAFDCAGGTNYTDVGAVNNSTCTFNDNGTYPVSARVTDGQGGQGFATLDVLIANVAPIATFRTSSQVNEGSLMEVSFINPVDPSSVDVDSLHYAFSCHGSAIGNSYESAGTDATVYCIYPSGPDSQIVRGRVIDKNDGFTDYFAFITVDNVAPVVSAGADATIAEGATFDQSGSFTDPGADTWMGTVDYGDGSAVANLSIYQTAKTFLLSHTYTTVGVYTVTVTINDGTANVSDTVLVTVTNVAPTARFNHPSAVNEGSAIDLSLTGVYDPGTEETLTYAFDCGSGTFGTYSTVSTASCPTTDNGTLTVRGAVRDDNLDFGETIYTASVTVNDVLPSAVSAGGPYTATAGQPVTLNGNYTCVAVDTCTAAWDLNNGTAFETSGNPITHTWNAPGSYPIGFKVTDNDGNAVFATVDVTVNAASQSILLQPGWNLVSFYLHPSDTAVASVLSSILTRYDLVYAWDAAVTTPGWLSADDQTGSPNTLTNLSEAQGFWVHITGTGTATLIVTGSVPTSTTISLASGWNMVGYPTTAMDALPDALTGTHTDAVYAYHANDTQDPWKVYEVPPVPAWVNDLSTLSNGYGYWVHTTAAGSWTVTNP